MDWWQQNSLSNADNLPFAYKPNKGFAWKPSIKQKLSCKLFGCRETILHKSSLPIKYMNQVGEQPHPSAENEIVFIEVPYRIYRISSVDYTILKCATCGSEWYREDAIRSGDYEKCSRWMAVAVPKGCKLVVPRLAKKLEDEDVVYEVFDRLNMAEEEEEKENFIEVNLDHLNVINQGEKL